MRVAPHLTSTLVGLMLAFFLDPLTVRCDDSQKMDGVNLTKDM